MAIAVSVLIGGVSSAAGYWLGPVLACGDVTTESARYCGLTWWFLFSNAVVLLGGLLGGVLLGLSSRIWIAAMIGLVVGNLVGPIVGVEIAQLTPHQDALFGSSPKSGLGGAWVAGLLFTAVGGVLYTGGWAIGGAVHGFVASVVAGRGGRLAPRSSGGVPPETK